MKLSKTTQKISYHVVTMAMLYFKIKTQMLRSPLQPFSLCISPSPSIPTWLIEQNGLVCN